MKLRRAWAIIARDSDPRNERYWWPFDVYRTLADALRCKSPDELIVRIEYRLPETKRK